MDGGTVGGCWVDRCMDGWVGGSLGLGGWLSLGGRVDG